jgi:hypothetical protein
MVYDPDRQVWEGNRAALSAFERPDAPAIALIANLGRANVPQVSTHTSTFMHAGPEAGAAHTFMYT